MENKREELLREAVRAESNMAQLYTIFGECFEEDKAFWEEIAAEERQHASLIDLGRDVLSEHVLSRIFLYDNLDELKEANKKIEELIEKYGEKAPSKEEAYTLAAELEEGSFELFYQKKMTDPPNSKDMDILQRLNGDSKDHATRIRKLLKGS